MTLSLFPDKGQDFWYEKCLAYVRALRLAPRPDLLLNLADREVQMSIGKKQWKIEF